MRILILDNYDSFTYNLVHYVKELTESDVKIARNDQISLQEVDKFTHILLSPGPGIPSEAGIMNEVIREYATTKNIFGVCLGMQAIGEVFGGQLVNLDRVYHGLAMPMDVLVADEKLFHGLPKRNVVGRYHSWVVDAKSIPEELEMTAVDDNDLLMALRHRKFNVRGVQFHPESVLTENGKQMIKNWINI